MQKDLCNTSQTCVASTDSESNSESEQAFSFQADKWAAIETKLKSFAFVTILILTLFCVLIYAVRSCDWKISSYFAKGKSSMKHLPL